jgi:hypothetical protein
MDPPEGAAEARGPQAAIRDNERGNTIIENLAQLRDFSRVRLWFSGRRPAPGHVGGDIVESK